MAVSDDSDDDLRPLYRARQAGGSKRKLARPVARGEAASGRAGVQNKKASSGLAKAPAPASASEIVAAVAYVWADDADALDCGVCFQPLKPPIFQCNVGHVVCSPCCEKLKATGKCYVCGISTGGYSRCHAMERLVECIRVQCPNTAHGCTTRPAYYEQHSHCRTCPHAPCHCPGQACSFSGSTAAFLDHIAGVHGWPSTTKIRVGNRCTVQLGDGFNFILANRDADGSQGTTGTPAASNQWLILLNVARQPLDRLISVLCVHPHAAFLDQGPSSKEIECSLIYSQLRYLHNRQGGGRLISHYQSSTFGVACTDLSNGLPNPDECYRFAVPNSVVGDHDAHNIQVEIIIK